MRTDADPLDSFARELDAIVAQTADYRVLVARAKPLLQSLLADMAWLSPRYCELREARSVQYLLRPTGAYTVTSAVRAPGHCTPVHDHGTWGLIGVWRGEEREERFERIHNPRPEHVQLRVAGEAIMGPGNVSCLVPPDDDIHRICSVSSYPSCSIHIYGAGLRRQQFDLTTGVVAEWPTNWIATER